MHGTVRELADACVYTIVHRDRLEAALNDGQSMQVREKKRWVGAARLLDKARADGLILPIVFADAASISGLLCWGAIEAIALDDDGTTCVVRDLQRLSGRETLPDLTLLSTGKPLPASYIYPYAPLPHAGIPPARGEGMTSGTPRNGFTHYWANDTCVRRSSARTSRRSSNRRRLRSAAVRPPGQ